MTDLNYQLFKDKMKNKHHGLHLLIVPGLIILLSACATTGSQPQANTGAPLQNAEKMSSEEPLKETVKVTEFILGSGDKVEINVYRHDDLKKTVQIDVSGKITYPLLGDIQAGGLSIFQLRDKIRDGLSKYLVDPQVSVGVASVQGQKVIVLGEVRTPGFFQIETSMTVLEAVSRAGGFTLDGKKKSVLLIRGGLKTPQLITLNLEKALSKGDLAQNIQLQRDDIVYVPRTYISNVDRFFGHLSTIISPLLQMESGFYVGQGIEGER
ncbi:MAG: polysaccharide export protein [Nitrospirae bacterium]|nr:polysaccharide export protein [Nitrospirota bacterium]